MDSHSDNTPSPRDRQLIPILFVDTLKFWGGGEQIFIQCARGLMMRGYDVAVAAREDAPLWVRAEQFELSVVSLRGRSDVSLRDAICLRQWLRAHHGARIFCATTRDVKLIRLATLGQRFGATVIWMMGSLVLRQRRRDRALAIRATDQFIVPSHALKRELESLGYIKSGSITVIPNGLDLDAWTKPDPMTQHDNQERPIVGVFSRLDRRKGIDVLLEAWPAVLKKHPTAQLWIVGTGPEEATLMTQAEPLRESVTFHGYTESVRDLMLKVDVVVQPSRYEPFGVVLLEAMACAKPVVCTAVGGMVEFVDESCGIVVSPESPSELAAAISRILSDPDRAAQLGAHGRQQVEEQYSLRSMVDRLERVSELSSD